MRKTTISSSSLDAASPPMVIPFRRAVASKRGSALPRGNPIICYVEHIYRSLAPEIVDKGGPELGRRIGGKLDLRPLAAILLLRGRRYSPRMIRPNCAGFGPSRQEERA